MKTNLGAERERKREFIKINISHTIYIEYKQVENSSIHSGGMDFVVHFE